MGQDEPMTTWEKVLAAEQAIREMTPDELAEFLEPRDHLERQAREQGLDLDELLAADAVRRAALTPEERDAEDLLRRIEGGLVAEQEAADRKEWRRRQN